MKLLLTPLHPDQKKAYFFMVLPLIITVILLLAGPIILTLAFSTQEYMLTKPDDRHFVGLHNFLLVFQDPRFWSSLKVAGYFVLYPVVLQIVLGMGFALLLTQKYWLNHRLRVLFLIPMMIPPIVNGIMWRLFFTPAVPGMSYLLKPFGLQNMTWFDKPIQAMFTIVTANVWTFTPIATIMFLAALESLPDDPIESAIIDGATWWQLLFRIKIPMIKPTIYFVATLRALDSLKIFPLIFVMTQGGPGTATEPLNYYIYTQAFRFLDIGYGSALIVVMVIISILMTIGLKKIMNITN